MATSDKYLHPVTVADEDMAKRCLRGRIIVIDDDQEILTALRFLLDLHGYACETYPSAHAYLEILKHSNPYFPGPCCVLSDVKMPGVDGLELQRRLSELENIPLLLMSGASDVKDAVLAFRSGVLDFLEKPVEAERLLTTLRKALDLSAQWHKQRTRQSKLAERIAELTPRERDIARRVATGQTNPAIAKELNIALRTVKLHRQRAFEKLHADCTADLVRIADEGSL